MLLQADSARPPEAMRLQILRRSPASKTMARTMVSSRSSASVKSSQRSTSRAPLPQADGGARRRRRLLDARPMTDDEDAGDRLGVARHLAHRAIPDAAPRVERRYSLRANTGVGPPEPPMHLSSKAGTLLRSGSPCANMGVGPPQLARCTLSSKAGLCPLRFTVCHTGSALRSFEMTLSSKAGTLSAPVHCVPHRVLAPSSKTDAASN